MKRVLILACLAAGTAFAGLEPMVKPRTLSAIRAMNERPVCTSRGRVVIGGVTNVVETWRRGNFTWAVTNVARNVFGKPQTNTFIEQISTLQSTIDTWKAKADEFEEKYQVKAKVIASVVDLLLKKRDAYVKLRDAAKLTTTKAIYQKFIDDIDEQLRELGETPPST